LIPLLFAAEAAAMPITTLEIEGSDGKEDEIAELLPRPLPTALTGAEIVELTRRIKNLALFDKVAVEQRGAVLAIRVRRKFVLTPIVDFSTGKTLADASATIGAIHNDIDGHASRLGLEVGYAERRPRFSVWLYEHPYRPRSWQNEYEVYYAGSSFRFEGNDGGRTWTRNRFGAEVEFLSPTVYGSRFRFELQFNAYREVVSNVESPGSFSPQDGTYLGVANEFIYDNYTWNDLIPKGVRAALELRPGAFVGAAQPRHELRGKINAALPLGENTGLVFFTLGDVLNGGNPNHSVLVGSQEGVRGLPDALYRNRIATYANLELRHAIEIATRWYVQGVVFTDAAVLEPMDAGGNATKWLGAWSTGTGVRLLPTALVDTLLRVDGSRLHYPFGAWFAQFGITQYI
jgi:hypothetical protein